MEKGEKLYLLNCDECKIQVAFFNNIHELMDVEYARFLLEEKRNTHDLVICFPIASRFKLKFFDEINPELDKLYFLTAARNYSLSTKFIYNYHFFTDKEKAIKALKEIIIPVKIQTTLDNAEKYKEKYMTQISIIENLEKILQNL
jgi:hypothetical protein